jgi:hypothetical protein
MYKPNFCAECGAKVLRVRWDFWISRKFCNACARRLRKTRFLPVLFATLALIATGYVAGRVQRPTPPPLLIVRRSDSPLNDNDQAGKPTGLTPVPATSTTEDKNDPASAVEEDVYICGARTKKGTPCSRRVHGPVRCWQHKGRPSIIPVVPIK